MKAVKLAILFLIPLYSIVVFAFYVFSGGGAAASEHWAANHGIHPEIAANYPTINSVTLTAWLATATLILMRRPAGAQLAATFATAYVLCDIVFYIPMARLAGEGTPIDQVAHFVGWAAYAIALPYLMNAMPARRAQTGEHSRLNA